MATLQEILIEETEAYIQTLNLGDDDYIRIQSELISRTTVRICQENQVIGKGGSKLSVPKTLAFWQISEILNKVMIIRILVDGENEVDDDMNLLGIYNGEIYDTNEDIIKKASICLNKDLKTKDLDEVIARLHLICERVQINKNPNLIAVNNGIFDYKKKKLLPFSEEYVFLSKSCVDWNPNAYLKTFPDGWNVNDWLHDISVDDEVYQLLWEVIGAALRPYVPWHKSIWLYSTTGNNGKGTFCQLVRNMLGHKAHTSIALSDFSKDFALDIIVGKQAVITDENDVGSYIDKAAQLKAIITGDEFTITRKFKTSINYRFRGIVIECLNEYPKIKDKSDSFYRRQIFVPFEKCFTGKENKDIKNVYLKDKDVLEYILHEVLMSNYYELSKPQICEDALKDYKENNDPLRQFWNAFETELQWDLVPYTFLYDLYKAWYERNFPKAQMVSNAQFINALNVIIKRESIIWEINDDYKKKMRPGNKMSKTEPLIIEYQLKNWYSKTYQGRIPERMATLLPSDLSQNYTGILRK